MTTMFPKGMKRMKRSMMETSTIRGFAGGWNAIDDDLSMAPRFVKTLKNFHRQSSGSQALRFGNKFFVDVSIGLNSSPIIDMIYFNGRIISVHQDGHIVSTTDAATTSLIWHTSIAAGLPGSPAGWSTGLTMCTFVPFKSTLIVHNGVDKPIVISSAFTTTYLQDAGTGSNTNVPIGKYGCTVSNYHCVAGITGSPTEIVISSKGTSGTFPLDPAPNDAISIDVGAYAAEGAATIRGIIGYRSYLIVFLQAVSLMVKLGVYNADGDHTPEFPDTFPSFGLIGSRCITKLENDIAFAGLRGLSTASRNTYNSDQLDSSSASSIIEPAFQRAIGNLTDSQKQLSTFTVYDQLSHDLLVFVPDTVPGLTKVGQNYTCEPNGFGPLLKFDGVPVTDKLWNPPYVIVGARPKDAGGYEVAFYAAGSDTYVTWDVDSDGNRLSTSAPIAGYPSAFTRNRVFVYTNNEKLRYKSWSEYAGMDWTCGCTSQLGRVFLAKGSRIFQMGNETFGEVYYADRLLDRDKVWAISTLYTVDTLVYDSVTQETYRVLVSHTTPGTGTFLQERTAFPLYYEQYLGISIDFDLELPWFDGKDPMKTKKLRFLSIASKGTAEFTFDMYVDGLFRDVVERVIYEPALSMTFIGNEFAGFGEELVDEPYGARRSRDPRLFGFPAKFKTAKFRIHGSTNKPLSLVNISFAFARGQYIRG